jgi:hypothetical protein
LETTLLGVESIGSVKAFANSPLFGVLIESEGVDSIWACEELCFARVGLNVFPAGVAPSAWNELEIVVKSCSFGVTEFPDRVQLRRVD